MKVTVDNVEKEDLSSIKEDTTKRKTVEITITEEEQALIFKGIKPENMDYRVFKVARRDIQRATKRYLGGKFSHISVSLKSIMGVNPEVKGTYIRDTKKRYEGIGRLWEKNMLNSQ